MQKRIGKFRVGILVGDWNVIGGLVVYWQWFGCGSVRYVGLVANIEMRSVLYVWLNGWLVRDLLLDLRWWVERLCSAASLGIPRRVAIIFTHPLGKATHGRKKTPNVTDCIIQLSFSSHTKRGSLLEERFGGT